MENTKELIERFASIQGISFEEAQAQVGADTEKEVMDKITQFTVDKINNGELRLNRKQRRALAKKNKGKNKKFASPQEQMEAINETAAKLNYIDLIQKLRDLNEKKVKENEEDGETTTEDD